MRDREKVEEKECERERERTRERERGWKKAIGRARESGREDDTRVMRERVSDLRNGRGIGRKRK